MSVVLISNSFFFCYIIGNNLFSNSLKLLPFSRFLSFANRLSSFIVVILCFFVLGFSIDFYRLSFQKLLTNYMCFFFGCFHARDERKMLSAIISFFFCSCFKLYDLLQYCYFFVVCCILSFRWLLVRC